MHSQAATNNPFNQAQDVGSGPTSSEMVTVPQGEWLTSGQKRVCAAHEPAGTEPVEDVPTAKRVSPPTQRSTTIAASAVRRVSFTETDILPKKVHVAIVRALVKQQLSTEWRQVDELNIANMALALEYTGINSLQEARDMDLRIIPPGPILHTWTAIHKTALFDGTNNPDKHSHLNYVERIKRSAAWLAEFETPVLVVYSECDMPAAEITKMRQYFEFDDNIVSLSLETDLKGILKSTPELASFGVAQLLDGLRVAILRDFPAVLEVAKEQALKHHKTRAWTGFCQRSESICYSDIDNSWLTKPPYIISRQGLHSYPCLNPDFLLSIPERAGILQQLSEKDRQRLQEHQRHFTDHTFIDLKREHEWTREALDVSFRYLFSGQARSEFSELLAAIRKINSWWFKHARPDMPLWDGDNGLISLRKDALKLFTEKAKIENLWLDFFEDPKTHPGPTGDPYYLKSNTLIGIQLWRYLFIGHDFSWRNF